MMEKRKAPHTQGQKHSKNNETYQYLLSDEARVLFPRTNEGPQHLGSFITKVLNAFNERSHE